MKFFINIVFVVYIVTYLKGLEKGNKHSDGVVNITSILNHCLLLKTYCHSFKLSKGIVDALLFCHQLLWLPL